MKKLFTILFTTLTLALNSHSEPISHQAHPQVKISNGSITASIWIPDPENGYYQGTRFDWSSHISSLRYKNHEYFGQWEDTPTPHNNPMGPAESFMANDQVLGYDEAKVGENFLRIGIGLCEKPQEDHYTWSRIYKITDHGTWTTTQGKNWIEFTHELSDHNGYAYHYTKRLTLTPKNPQLVITHTLQNTGQKKIKTEVFSHNFFVIDGQPSGPEFEINFPFPLTAVKADLKGRIIIDGNSIRYPQPMQPGMDGMIGTDLTGFGTSPEDNTFQITNKTTGAGVRSTMDQPLSKLHFWTIQSTICPEPYIYMEIPKNQSHSWTTTYDFFEVE